MNGEGNIKDRIYLEPRDFADLYEKFAESLKETPKKLRNLIPLFVIKESIRYFERLEQFEKCQLIKTFADSNPKRIAKLTREQWLDTAGM